MKKFASIFVVAFAVLLLLSLMASLFDETDKNIPDTITADYINDLNTGEGDYYSKVLHSEKIKQGYFCLVERKQGNLDVVYLEKHPDKEQLKFKSRASIDPSSLGSDPSVYDTITPLLSKQGSFTIYYSLFTEPEYETIEIAEQNVKIHKYSININGENVDIGFWNVVVD